MISLVRKRFLSSSATAQVVLSTAVEASTIVGEQQKDANNGASDMWLDKLEREGMAREQAAQLLALLDQFIAQREEHFYYRFARPHDYHQVISTLRQTQPSLLSESHQLLDQSTAHIQHKLQDLDSQTTQHRLSLQAMQTDVKAGLQLDVSLERKRLEEVASALKERAREAAEYAEGKVKRANGDVTEMQRRTSIVITTIGSGILSFFFVYNYLK